MKETTNSAAIRIDILSEHFLRVMSIYKKNSQGLKEKTSTPKVQQLDSTLSTKPTTVSDACKPTD